MDIDSFKIPPPIRFNLWKHHAGFIRYRVKNSNSREELNFIIKEMLSIGNSQMDLYTGDLSPAEISSFILINLKRNNIHSSDDYLGWIQSEGKDYRIISLKDSSVWALRPGNDDERYVHVHPGRYSINSVRVKATALKTAVVSLLWKKLNNLPELDLTVINYVRKNFIEAPPIKEGTEINTRGMKKIISLLEI